MFFLELPVKPYVKQYIILNYGNPASFSSNKYLNDRFRKCLIKPSLRHENYYKNLSFSKYQEKIKIILSQDDFYRYGWELSSCDIISFGKVLEHQTKFLMCNMISFYTTVMNIKDAILTFQNNFGFTEDIWPFESIKKVYDRFSASNQKISFTKDLAIKLEKLILSNLTDIGALLPPAITHYENNKRNI